MLRLRRRLLWTPAQIRHVPTAYRFLSAPPGSSTREDAQNGSENAIIVLPPPPRQADSASASTNFASSGPTSAHSDTIPISSDIASTSPVSDTAAPVPPHVETPALESRHVPEPKDQSIKAGPFVSEELAQRLRDWSKITRLHMRRQGNEWTATTLKRVSQLGGQLNQITGYEEIDTLKKHVVAQEERIQHVRTAARQAKIAHEEAVALRARSQREVNDLLSRKSTWSDDDVGRFTRLVRQDHLYEQAEATAKEAATKAEDDVEKEFSELMRAILNRYHEEQVWSDKIRSASTYGSLAVLGLNVLVFLLATIFVEPWKRKKLAATFEKKVDEMDVRNTLTMSDGMAAIHERLDRQEQALKQFSSALSATAALRSEPPIVARYANDLDDPISTPLPPPVETTTATGSMPHAERHAEPASPQLTVPLTWREQVPRAWREWRLLVDKQATEHVLVTASSAAFFGGAIAGWFIRELRR